jgi:hypothetical protein
MSLVTFGKLADGTFWAIVDERLTRRERIGWFLRRTMMVGRRGEYKRVTLSRDAWEKPRPKKGK